MKYRVGDKIYMDTGYQGVVTSLEVSKFNKSFYNVMTTYNALLMFEVNYLDSFTYSEKEWQKGQRCESWKFKIGDEILLPNLYPSSAIYKVEELYENYYVLSTKVDTSKHIVGYEQSKYPKSMVEQYGVRHIRPKQYIPRKNEQYFFVDLADENLFGIATFLNDSTDMHMLKLGLIKETPQECVKLAREMLKKLGLEV